MRCLSLFPAIIACALFLMVGGCGSSRGWTDRAVGWIPGVRSHPTTAAGETAEKTVCARGHLRLTLRLDPFPVKLSEARRVEAIIRLENKSSRFVQLEFPTSQRFELLVKDTIGATVVQWSEDQPFESVPGSVGINPGEHLDYRAVFSTRDLQPGKSYTVTAFFPNRSDLRVDLPFVPQR